MVKTQDRVISARRAQSLCVLGGVVVKLTKAHVNTVAKKLEDGANLHLRKVGMPRE